MDFDTKYGVSCIERRNQFWFKMNDVCKLLNIKAISIAASFMDESFKKKFACVNKNRVERPHVYINIDGVKYLTKKCSYGGTFLSDVINMKLSGITVKSIALKSDKILLNFMD